MTKGFKIWLWLILVVNVLAALSGLMLIGSSLGTAIYTLIVGFVAVAGAALLLFKCKKLGFYMMLATDIAGFIFNMMNGVGIVIALLSACIRPLITYYFITKNTAIIK